MASPEMLEWAIQHPEHLKVLLQIQNLDPKPPTCHILHISHTVSWRLGSCSRCPAGKVSERAPAESSLRPCPSAASEP